MRTPLLLTLLALSCRSNDKPAQPEVDTGAIGTTDADADGFSSDEDCDDTDPNVNGGAVEVCDGIDNDCDGEVDEGVKAQGFADDDGDSFGDPDAPVEACDLPDGAVSNANDCDDTDPAVFPGQIEACNEVDDDCDGEIDEDLQTTFHADQDGDGFGDADAPLDACAAPTGYVLDATDCDDGDTAVNPGAIEVCNTVDDDCDGEIDEEVTSTYWLDQDGDGYGGIGGSVEACETPMGYADQDGDCDDSDIAFYPGAPETDCADPNDYNCDGSVTYADVDGDGWAACEECDDNDRAVNPDAVEVCDGIDNDCDGATDDDDASVDLSTGSTWYADGDTDGYGDAATTTVACDQPSGFVADDTDCDDGSTAVNPGATEVCNGIDDDCDADIDDDDATVDLSTGSTWYDDADTDGYGDAAVTTRACDQPSGMVGNDGDCDDGDGAINPLATEVCDGIDNDCDTDVDDDDVDVVGQATWYVDGDSDGYGGATSQLACDQPSGTTAASTDCEDGDPAINPGATEVCDGIDNDCDADIDDDDSGVTGQGTWYLDGDSDGYAGASTVLACSQPSGSSASSSDCDDSDASINPGAAEVCDGVDNDCDSAVDEGFTSVSTSISTASPTNSCNGQSNRSVTFSACGCSDVTLTGSFRDNSDGSNGQVVGVSTGSSSFTLTWDDAPSGGDCDLDIRSAISWSASKSGTTLTIQVTDQITGYSAGNSLSAGYSITGYSTYRRSSGSGTRTFTYTCN